MAAVALCLVAGAGRAQDVADGVAGMALSDGGVEAAAWRKHGRQLVTIDDKNVLLFWDAKSRTVVDLIDLDRSLPPAPTYDHARSSVLRLGADGHIAAITVRPDAGPLRTVLIDLSTESVIATFDRPALFWTDAGLVAGPRAGCSMVCDFVRIDPATRAETILGTGYGDGRVVAVSPDGTRFATSVGGAQGATLIVWTMAAGPMLRVAVPPGAVDEIGFDRAGTRVFARQGRTRLVVVDIASGQSSAVTLGQGDPRPDPSENRLVPILQTDLDRGELLTGVGRLRFAAAVPPPMMSGGFSFYFTDPQFGDVYVFDDGTVGGSGGRPARNIDFPWQVELRYTAARGKFSNTLLHNCGGSLIRTGWVLTATHCFLDNDNQLRSDRGVREHTIVRAGSSALDGDMVEFDIAEVFIPHCIGGATPECFRDSDPDATPPTAPANDIALLRIVKHVEPPAADEGSRPRKLKPGPMTPIRLPPVGADPPAALPVTMTGWGVTSAAGAAAKFASPMLNRIDVAVVSRDACSAENHIAPLAATTICAGSPDNVQSACRGDSGGPLVADVGRKPVLIGIVSWGACEAGPAVYTRVAAYIPWITTTIAAAEARN